MRISRVRMASPKPKPTMKERILETADRLFYLKGIRAIGVDTIAAEIGISKRTLYNHFPSKDALISAYLERRFVRPYPSDKSPLEQILGTFDSLERRFSAKDFRGCPFVNAVAELGPESKSVRRIAIAFKESPASGSATSWCRSALLTRKASRRSWCCSSTVRLRRIWCVTNQRWPVPRRKPPRCCCQMRA